MGKIMTREFTTAAVISVMCLTEKEIYTGIAGKW